MRYSVIFATALVVSACASQGTAPAPAAAAPMAKKGPQCWSGDHSRFFAVEDKTTVAGVAVTCKATADGKAGQWVGAKN